MNSVERRAGDAGQTGLGCRGAVAAGTGAPVNLVEAYKWMSLGLARSPADTADKFRPYLNQLAARMTATQIAEAKRQAQEWLTKFEASKP